MIQMDLYHTKPTSKINSSYFALNFASNFGLELLPWPKVCNLPCSTVWSHSKRQILLDHHKHIRFGQNLCYTQTRMSPGTAPGCTTRNISRFLASNFDCIRVSSRILHGKIFLNISRRQQVHQEGMVLGYQP